MRLQIERLDVSGKVVASSTVWVLGGVPMDGRAYFRASVSDAASYRVQVLSFDWAGGSCGGGGGGGAHRPARATPSRPRGRRGRARGPLLRAPLRSDWRLAWTPPPRPSPRGGWPRGSARSPASTN